MVMRYGGLLTLFLRKYHDGSSSAFLQVKWKKLKVLTHQAISASFLLTSSYKGILAQVANMVSVSLPLLEGHNCQWKLF